MSIRTILVDDEPLATQGLQLRLQAHDDVGPTVIVGPAVGGVVFALWGATACFVINGVSFLAVILALFFAVPVILMGAGVLGVLPLTGVVTPFLSFGGSAMVANFAAVGLLAAMRSESRPAADLAVFTPALRWVGGAFVAAAAVLLVALAAGAFWYTQRLPVADVETLTSATAELPAVVERARARAARGARPGGRSRRSPGCAAGERRRGRRASPRSPAGPRRPGRG